MLAVGSLVCVHLALLLLYDLGSHPRLAVTLLVLGFGCHAWACRRFELRITPVPALAIAGLLRLVLLPLPPTLSDDILRYQWDGRVAVAGHNPYRWAPEDPALSDLRDALWRDLPHKEVPTVYPPVALGLFSIASLLPWPATVIKLLLVAADLLACWLLMRLASTRGSPPGRALWYAWSPLATVEIGGMGHIDALVVLALVATWTFLGDRKPKAAGAAAAAGVLAKLVPVVVWPMWARQSKHPWRMLAVAAGVVALATGPFLIDLGGPPPGLVTYGVSWEFDGPLYEPLWRGLDRIGADERIKATLDVVKQRTDQHDALNRVYPFVYPQLLAKLLLAALFAGVVAASCLGRHPRWRDPVAGTGCLLGALVLCSATVYPWYLLWILPAAALTRHKAWLVLPASIQLSYLPQLTDLVLFPWIFVLVWLPFIAVWISSRWSSD